GAGNRAKRAGAHHGADGAAGKIGSQAVTRIPEAGMVEKVKGFEPELEILAFTQVKVLLGGEVDVEYRDANHHVAARVAISVIRESRVIAGQCSERERLNVEPLVRGPRTCRDILTHDDIGTVVPDSGR